MRTLYVTDLDGTLLLPDGSLGRRTRVVVNTFIASGGLITYATGRSFHSANRIMTDLNLHLPVITYAGAMLPIVFLVQDGRDRFQLCVLHLDNC
jgi:hydroxymethylpyrimidine pyrophosphatase-like HAD family hydrolase